jgi:threonine dehydratase
VSIEVPKTIADGQQLTRLGEFPFAVMPTVVDEVEELEEHEIAEAVLFFFKRMKIVAEPSGAIGLAALLKRGDLGGAKAGVIISGGNIGIDRLASIRAIAKGGN